MAFFQDLLRAVPQAAAMTMSQNSGVPLPTQMTPQSLAQFVPQAMAANRQRQFYGDMMAADPTFATQYFTGLDNMHRTALAEQELSIRQSEAERKAQEDARRAQALENLSNMLLGDGATPQGQIQGVPALQALFALDPERGVQMMAQQQLEAASPQNQLAQIELARQANTQRVLSGAQPMPINPQALADMSVPPITEAQLEAPYTATGPTPFPPPPTQRAPEALATSAPQQTAPTVTALPDVRQIASQAENYRQRANEIIAAGGDMQTAQSLMTLSSDLEKTIFEREKEETARQKTLVETEEGKKLRAQTLQDAIYEIENNILPAIENAKQGVSKKFTGGAIGQVTSMIGGTPAFDLETDIETIKSNAALDNMLDMKQKSPNGATGMGSTTEKEFETLKNNIANLKIGLSDEKLLKNLETVRRQYARTLANAKKGYSEITGVSLDNNSGKTKGKIEVLGFE